MTGLVSNVDVNRRPDPIFSRIDFISSENLKRIALIAIPFLSLHQGIATAISLGSGAGQVYKHLQEESPDVKKIAMLVGTAALFFFNPMLGLFLTHGTTLAMDVSQIASDILEGKTESIFDRGEQMLSTALYLASAYYGTPLLTAVSLLFQAYKEFREAVGEYQEGRYLEMAAKFFMGIIRSAKAKAQAVEFYRDKFGKEMTQNDWDKVIEELKQRIEEGKGSEEELNQPFMTQTAWNLIKDCLWGESDFESLLNRHNFRREIQGIKIGDQSFDDLTFRNISFIDCQIEEASFEEATLDNVRFDKCMLQSVSFIKTVMNRVFITESNFSRANFFQAKMTNCSFLQSDLSRASFNETLLDSVEIVSSKLFGANFLKADVLQSLMKTCDLTDVLLVDAKDKFTYENCTEHRITRPVIALGWSFESYSWATDVNDALENRGALVLKHPFEVSDISYDLSEEVQNGIAAYENQNLSIPQHLMTNGPWGTETQKIYDEAKLITDHADGVIIPGGADVEEEFYNPNYPLYDYYNRYGKSIKEYALIHEFVTRKKPLMGICRGMQITNTYFKGGTIKNVSDQFGEQILELQPTKAGDTFRGIIGEELWGSSAHSQAVDQLGEGLEVALKAGGVIKAAIGLDGNVLLTQFHPERFIRCDQVEKGIESGDPEFQQGLSMQGLISMYNEDGVLMPTLRLNENRQIELNRQALEEWIRRYEECINAVVKGILQLKNNHKIIDYFLSRTVSKMETAAPAA
ncbi:MAG: gamma-glutamyl-gamma-aminobutyrate hydrolase family protein [Simkania sp.]|nr:gamma-glutamyl-gamma-aminobutyrate hydrolase family protein [Simkania sp.]